MWKTLNRHLLVVDDNCKASVPSTSRPSKMEPLTSEESAAAAAAAAAGDSVGSADAFSENLLVRGAGIEIRRAVWLLGASAASAAVAPGPAAAPAAAEAFSVCAVSTVSGSC